MMYHGKLYGKLWDKYFDTSHTTDEWDAMVKKIAELEAQIEKMAEKQPEVRIPPKNYCTCVNSSGLSLSSDFKCCLDCGKPIKNIKFE